MMYADTKTKKDRMKKGGGSASSINLLGKMSSEKNRASKVKAMAKVLAKAKKK